MKLPRNYPALAIGLCALVAALFCIYSAAEFRTTSVVVTGTVIRLSSGGHHPRIEFNTADGEHHERTTGTFRSFETGQAVAVRYSPNDPQGTAMIDSALDLWAPSAFLLVLAAGLLDAGLRGERLRKGM